MEKQIDKKFGVTMGELIGASIVILGAVLMFWKTTDVRISALEIRMENKEKVDDQISSKLDRLQESINEVKIALQNKEDKK
jgi:hypothetical protein